MIVKQLIFKQINFLSLFLCLTLGVSTYIFGARAPRQRSALSLEVADFGYWQKKPERFQDLEQLAEKLNAEKLRRSEEGRRPVAAGIAKNKQSKEAEQRWSDLLWKINAVQLQGIEISINSSLGDLERFCGISGYNDRLDKKKYSLLHSAVLRGDREEVKFLLGCGADPRLRFTYEVQTGSGSGDTYDEHGPSPLDLAVDIGVKGGDRSMVEIFKQSMQKKVEEEEEKQAAIIEKVQV